MLRGFVLVVTDRATGTVEEIDGSHPRALESVQNGADFCGWPLWQAVKWLKDGQEIKTFGFIRKLKRA